MKPQPPALAPQNGVISEGQPPHPPNMSFLPPENGIHSLAQQEEDRKRLSARIGQQAEQMYGPDCKITQSQWNEAVALVERMEEQERRQRDEMAMQGQNGRRREWMRRENASGEYYISFHLLGATRSGTTDGSALKRLRIFQPTTSTSMLPWLLCNRQGTGLIGIRPPLQSPSKNNGSSQD